ncbi:MAG: alpha-amylase family glycosyl hydrolase [Geminicoccaceae bacterium]
MIDFVPSHTSSEHAWFREPFVEDNPKADWYVVGSGARWNASQQLAFRFRRAGSSTRDAASIACTISLKQQPDLNFHNPEVIDALMGEARFWFERGSTVSASMPSTLAMHDELLRSNRDTAITRDQHGGDDAVQHAVPALEQGASGALESSSSALSPERGIWRCLPAR